MLLNHEALAKVAGLLRRRDARAYEQPAPPAKPQTLAEKIVDVAERVRNGSIQPAPPPKGSLAAQIIAAGRKRRGEAP